MNSPTRPTLLDIGEDALIERLAKLLPIPAGSAAGPGDDCAVIDSYADPQDDDLLFLLKTDAVVESIHYTPDTAADRVGWKAIMRVVSDFAAMGGAPDRFLITLGLPANCPVDWVDLLYLGMSRAMKWCGGTLAGGETSAVPIGSAAFISISATGHVKRQHLVLRSTACPGDAIYVTGRLGGSFASGRHLDFHPRLNEAAWLVRHFKPTAMMDLSDGLAADLPKLARTSSVGFTLDYPTLPCHAGIDVEAALNHGEDFELLFTLEGNSTGLESAWKSAFPDVLLTRIGTITEATGETHRPGGWRHFNP